MDIQDVKIKDIVITQNSRIDMKDLAELMESIKQHGLLHPIHVGKTADGKFIFESGRRRLLACEKLGWQTIPAVVSTEKKYKDLLVANVTENIQRKDLTVVELGRICTELQNQNMNAKEIAVALSTSLSKVQIALDAYKRVPARFRKKVTFIDQRTTIQKGHISATATQQLLSIRRQYKLSQSEFDNLFEVAIEDNLSALDVKVIAGLLNSGLTINQALKEKDIYKDYTVILTTDEDHVNSMAAKYKIAPLTLIQKVLYGEVKETFKRPKFLVKKPGTT